MTRLRHASAGESPDSRSGRSPAPRPSRGLRRSRIHDDDAARRRAVLAHRVGELPLGRELHARVEREDERRALLRRPAVGGLGLAVAAAPRVGQRHDLAGLAADRTVVEVLESREADGVGADEAEHGAGEPPLRIEALGLGDEVDPGELELPDPVGRFRIELTPDPDEAAVAPELLEHLARGHAEDRGRGARPLRADPGRRRESRRSTRPRRRPRARVPRGRGSSRAGPGSRCGAPAAAAPGRGSASPGRSESGRAGRRRPRPTRRGSARRGGCGRA